VFFFSATFKETVMSMSSLTRRTFLATATTTMAFGAVTMKDGKEVIEAPPVTPNTAKVIPRKLSPNEKVNLAAIGAGGKGYSDLMSCKRNGANVVAIADVDWDRCAEAIYRLPDAKKFKDFRIMLETMPEIDAVTISAPDHIHAPAAYMAMMMGKHCYVQKPLTHTVAEARLLKNTAEECGVMTQMGNQGHCGNGVRTLCEMISSGAIGDVREVHVWTHRPVWDNQGMDVPLPPEVAPENLDWDRWIGPAPWRPYNEEYVLGGWRGDYDFHTSCIGEWGAHTFAQAQMGLGLGETSPVKYEYVDNDSGDGMVCHFSTGQKLIFSRGDKYWYGSCGELFEGERGWVAAADGYSVPDVSDPEMLAEFDEVVGEYKARTGRSLDHMRNFLDCVKTRQEPVANPRVMHHSMCTVHAANICMWLERDLVYDPKKECFVNDDEANCFLARAERAPWTL
jgi:predicted dehydrogenase